jgi:hypothetical protein
MIKKRDLGMKIKTGRADSGFIRFYLSETIRCPYRRPPISSHSSTQRQMTTITDSELMLHAESLKDKVVLITGASNGIGQARPSCSRLFPGVERGSLYSGLLLRLLASEQKLSLEILILLLRKTPFENA